MTIPLIYQITNTVSAQLQADCTAILGGSSIMTDNIEEAAKTAASCDALLINTGTPPCNAYELYSTALRAAADNAVPAVLDAVGCGFSKYRTDITRALLEEFNFSVIKGNEAEIGALAGAGTAPRGVSCSADIGNAAELAASCARRYRCAVYCTGRYDHLSDGSRLIRIGGGSPLLRRTSGIGCALGSATALFCASMPPFDACRRALRLFRRAASAAEGAPGPYSFRIRVLDLLAEFNETERSI